MSTLYLTQNQTSDYRIVISQTADAVTVNAANELSAYLAKITGISLPVVTDDTPAAEREIIVGIAQDAKDVIPDIAALGEDSFVIHTHGEKLHLLGASGRGNLYAVYEPQVPPIAQWSVAPVRDSFSLPMVIAAHWAALPL